MRNYITLWLLLTLGLGFEYWALSQNQNLSLFLTLQKSGFISDEVKINTTPGRTLSLWLGWIGFGLMVMMNVYSLRKRFEFMKNLGKLSFWLNFHVFCGILGPTLIFFHCGLKVRGLVGISFWSMVVSLTSGIIGRYLFVQLSAQRNDFEVSAQEALDRLNRTLEKMKIDLEAPKKEKILKLSLAHVGANINGDLRGPVSTLFSTLEGDLRLLFSDLPVPKTWPLKAKALVLNYAISKRKAQSLGPFEKLMGYWHAFHFPFAVFMYLAAIVHIISSLIFLSPH